MLKIRTYPLGPIQTNCYFIQDESGNCLIIDPGEEGTRLIRKIKKLELTPVAILLTHAHFDHIGAVDALRDRFDIPVYLHSEEREWLSDAVLNGSARYPGLPYVQGRKADHLITEEGMMEIGPFKFEARFTPGHSPGSVSFIFELERCAFVGDTLFQQSIGRTDLPGGNTRELLTSIHDKLLTLDDGVIIYPGHGPSTTPAIEKDSNPFLNGF
ncbi:MBL fold metallo-hydrolase [Sporosarcina limicola]|uniref:Glyoxylase-like metal-dependent hydrolase (Beta-lactamase superfamily II) n=1 Tax=Sporosarcina limicola TaxID=34101 RepID=A0A927RBV2_9BACL|nr:MBL fold metallo-hydrolase [Sporosarcina limicola]MBE1553755.1 glyoxylase-like metal-dependent hydrolase (beta-lactamase superfamily II) [Sporosarcina limicola]